MKLIQLHVENFGGLHDFDYEFSDGVNILLQDNGWGKTTMAAFLKAMLYGFDTRRSKDITENERRRYLPWQGGKYGGSLDFEANGVNYRVFRTFGETPRFDTTKIVNMDTRTTARIDPEKIGETLFGLDVNAFQRSVFINQNGLAIDGASSSIHTRLNSLVSQANDLAAYDGAITDLTQQIKVYEKTGARGKLGDIAREIAAKERERDRLEREIADQDEARERVSRIDMLLSALNSDLEEKKKRLDELSGETKKREAAQKLAEDIDRQIKELHGSMDAARGKLGGTVPSVSEIDAAKKQADEVDSLSVQLKKLAEQHESLSREQQDLQEKFPGAVPSEAQLNELQSLYSELQGLSTSEELLLEEKEQPEGYRLISAASKSIADYPALLSNAIDRQAELDSLTRKKEDLTRSLSAGAEVWREKKARYAALCDEVDRCRKDLDARVEEKPENLRSAIQELDELKKLRQEQERRQKELAAKELSPEERERLVKADTTTLPTENEGEKMLEKLRHAKELEAQIKGAEARLAGEESKEASLQAALAQYSGLTKGSDAAPAAPKKPASGGMIGGGIAAIILSAALGLLITPALAIAAALGIVLIILGVNANKKYVIQLQTYESAKAAEGQRQEAQRKQAELEKQLSELQKTITAIREEIDKLSFEAEQMRDAIRTWLNRFAEDSAEMSEASIRAVMKNAGQIQALRERAVAAEDEDRALQMSADMLEGRQQAFGKRFPALQGLSIDQQIDTLRASETRYQVCLAAMKHAEKELESYLTATGLTKQQLSEEKAPDYARTQAVEERTEQEIAEVLEQMNLTFSLVGLEIKNKDSKESFRSASQLLTEYRNYRNVLEDQRNRRKAHREKQEALQRKLDEALLLLPTENGALSISERITKARQELSRSKTIGSKLAEGEEDQARVLEQQQKAERAVASFCKQHGRPISGADAIAEIRADTDSYTKWAAAVEQLEKQKAAADSNGQDQSVSEEETSLRREIADAEGRRDSLLVEYTQKIDAIRQADQALELYPDTVQEIRQLYEQKQKAQNRLVTLKRAIQLITKAKENLANRYLGKVEALFNRYMQVWLQSDTVRGMLDTDFRVTIEENGKVHVAEGYSTGTSDLIDFCMRLALVDTLFEKEQPFLILDDPFVNLDEERLEKALELLQVMGANKQIVYFVCHPIRAAETGEPTGARAEFKKLSEATRATLGTRKTLASAKPAAEKRKTPKEMYHVPSTAFPAAVRPTRPNYVITNSIFSISFSPVEDRKARDHSYELFFIDKPGHVICERQLIELRNGKLSTERVQFSLSTREDSGDEYELLVRESGQNDYEIVARFPFRAKMAFAGTFSFD